MPEQKSAIGQAGGSTTLHAEWIRHLRAMISDCDDIPSAVSEASFNRVDERQIDDSFLQLLTEYWAKCTSNDAMAATIKRRIDALSPYLGRTLVCVLIRLPGVSYTIEIDPTAERIVHWEWQSA